MPSIDDKTIEICVSLVLLLPEDVANSNDVDAKVVGNGVDARARRCFENIIFDR